MVPLFSAIIKIKNGSTKMKSIMHMCYGWFGLGKPSLNIQSIIYRKCAILHLRYVKLKKNRGPRPLFAHFSLQDAQNRNGKYWEDDLEGILFGGMRSI